MDDDYGWNTVSLFRHLRAGGGDHKEMTYSELRRIWLGYVVMRSILLVVDGQEHVTAERSCRLRVKQQMEGTVRRFAALGECMPIFASDR